MTRTSATPTRSVAPPLRAEKEREAPRPTIQGMTGRDEAGSAERNSPPIALIDHTVTRGKTAIQSGEPTGRGTAMRCGRPSLNPRQNSPKELNPPRAPNTITITIASNESGREIRSPRLSTVRTKKGSPAETTADTIRRVVNCGVAITDRHGHPAISPPAAASIDAMNSLTDRLAAMATSVPRRCNRRCGRLGKHHHPAERI